MSLLKINILRHLVCDVTSSPFPRPPRGWGGNAGGRVKDRTRARYCHFRCYNDVISGTVTSGAIMTSGREKRLKPTRIYGYDVTSGL